MKGKTKWSLRMSKKSSYKRNKQKQQRKFPFLTLLLILVIIPCGFHLLRPSTLPTEIVDTVEVDKIAVSINKEVQLPKVEVSTLVGHFLKKNCQSCHGEKKQKGDQRFDTLSNNLSTPDTIQLYQDILDKVNLGEMPPEDEPEIPAEELTNFIDDLTATIAKAKEYTLNRGQNPPMRFLNKRELKLTYRDLLGVRVNLDQIPDAPEISQFDTLAEEQFFTESHWEASYKVAKDSLKLALDGELQTDVFKLRYECETNKIANMQKVLKEGLGKIAEFKKKLETETVTQNRGHLNNNIKSMNKKIEYAKREINNPLFKTGALYSESKHLMDFLGFNFYRHYKFKHGRYRLTIRCGAVHDKPNQQTYISTASHKQLINPEYQPYENFYREVKGTPEKPETLSFYWDFGPGKGGGSGYKLGIDSDASVWFDWVELEGPLTPDYMAKSEMKFLSQYNSWDIPKALEVIKSFAFKAYRSRNISSEQMLAFKEHLRNQKETGADPKETLKDMFAVILSSPEFLYLVSETESQQVALLDSLSLANKLSYFLCSTQPDSKLLAQVSSGDLKDKELLNECDRMLDSEKSNALIDSFTFQWLELSRFVSVNPNIHAKRTNLIKWPRKHFFMLRESMEAMKHIIKNNLPITDMLNPDYCYINNTLANYYALPLSKESGFSARSQAKDKPRGGISNHASFLFMTSRGNRTSPVERGVYLKRNILFEPPPPAPPNVPDLTASIGKTIKERFSLKKLNISKSSQLMLFHNEQPQCKSCHRNFDPLGLALEGFDHYGSWKGETTKNVGQLPSGEEINGALGLATYLNSQKELFIRGFIKTLMGYAIHRPISIVDQKEIDKIYNENKAAGFKARDIIKSIVISKSFKGT